MSTGERETERETILEHQKALLLASSNGCSVYQFRNETGDGTMTCYEVFPASHYHGLTVSFDMSLAGKALEEEIKDFPVDLDALELPESKEEKPYFYKTQVEKVNAVKNFLAENIAENFTQEELAEKFDLSLTGMKKCFKSIYGTSIGAWLTTYRMNREFSVTAGLIPFFCMYQIICGFVNDTISMQQILIWCGLALAAYIVKILCFAGSTGTSHQMAYHVLEGLRLRVADRFLHAPLGEVEAHTIGEIKNIMNLYYFHLL